MATPSGLRKERVTILNRKEAQQGRFGLDSAGIEFEPAGVVWARVSWAKGNRALNAGALDAYAVNRVDMLYNPFVTERSRVQYNGRTYQILPETFERHFQENSISFLMQELVNDK